MSVRARKRPKHYVRTVPIKIVITTRIDADTLARLRKVAAVRRVGYQTLINEILYTYVNEQEDRL